MNIYSVLDESDDEEQPKVVPPKKVNNVVTGKPAPAAKKDAAVKSTKPEDAKPKGKGDNAQPANANKAKETKPAASADKSKSAPAVDSSAVDSADAKDNNRGGRPRGKESFHRGGGGRGGRGGAEGAAEGEKRPKREFERRSATGRGREVSKGGRGAFGFGNPAQDAQDAEKDPNSADVAIEAVDGAEEAAVVVEEAEPEPVTYSLDEFLEKRNEARKALLSSATETKVRVVDQSALAGLSRKEDLGETTYMPIKAAKGDATKKDQRSTGKNQVLDVGFKFEAIQVDDGGRGGRGEGRGGRGDAGRGGRGGRSSRGDGSRPARTTGAPSNKGAQTVFNTQDFPSL